MSPQFISPAYRHHVEALLSYSTELSQNGVESLQRLAELQLQLARDLIAEFGERSQHLMASKDATQLGSAAGAYMNPAGNAVRNFQQRSTELLHRLLSRQAAATQEHMPAISRSIADMAEEYLRLASEESSRATERQKQAWENLRAPGTQTYAQASQTRH